jgi:hypothetical protein
MGRELKEYTGRKINGWDVLRCVSFGGNRYSRWLARHTCGHEQEVVIKQLTDGRPGLCSGCGKTNLRKEAAKVASMVAARTRGKKPGGTLMDTIEKMKKANKELSAPQTDQFNPSDKDRETGEVKKRVKIKMTAWQIGYEQAKAMSRWNL